MQTPDTVQKQREEIDALKDKLREYEETLNAIRNGEVDALLVAGKKGEQVYTLKGAEHPYRAFIENMNEGAVTLNPDGVILYCNPRFGAMMKQPVQTLIGRSVLDQAASPQDRGVLKNILTGRLGENNQAEITLRSSDATSFPAKISVSGLNIEETLTFCMVVTNLTERKQKEEFRALAENSPDIILRINRQLRVVYANPAAAAVFGRGVVGKSVPELCRSIQGNTFWQKLANQTFATTETTEFVFQYVAPGGQTHFYDARIVPELNGRGQVMTSLTVARDVTQLKEIEQHLHEAVSEAKRRAEEAEEGRRILEAVLDYVPEGFTIVDAKTENVRTVSKYLAQFAGLERKHYDNIPLSRYAASLRALKMDGTPVPEQDSPLWRSLHRGEIIAGEQYFLTNKEGKRIAILVSATPIRDSQGLITGALSSWRDISTIKAVEDTLRRNEYELRTLVDNSPDIIFRLNRRLQYVFVNPAYERLTGITKEQFVGKTNSELGMPPQMAEFWQSSVQSAMEGGREHAVEFDLMSIFGTRYFFARLIPEFEKSGLVETVLVIARDVTERKRAEEKIRYISFHDEVTGLYNRAFFEEEIRRVDTERELPVSIIMGDVNNLKLSNDVFGHDEGDKLLKAIAAICRAACRKNDIIARWGGDEFAIILPETPHAVAGEVRDRIKQTAGETAGTAIPPSIALGIATKEHKEHNIYQTIRQAEERMYRNKLDESRRNEDHVFSSLFERLRERRKDYDSHVERSLELADRFGTALGFSENERDDIRLLIKLHDIGEAVLPPDILSRPGRLNDREWELIKKHAEGGFRIVKAFADTARISDEVLSHNERWDGSGYPRGLAARTIPYLVRVFRIIDVFDVITHPRPYARTFTRDEAAEELRRNAGRQFDPQLVEAFVRTVSAEAELVKA
jgi:diguanylate cyclase (GGDEF)-like protein/PAS domain S-box-containing protein